MLLSLESGKSVRNYFERYSAKNVRHHGVFFEPYSFIIPVLYEQGLSEHDPLLMDCKTVPALARNNKEAHGICPLPAKRIISAKETDW